ncbi:hypothetical protein BDZ89DRAFT_1144394 [Hymenopellis radicata]|nr:hypothetical protein BDZ89DRAFT_1144394 [Hymenopellis radicata]
MESHYDKDTASKKDSLLKTAFTYASEEVALDTVSNKRSHAIEGHLGSEPEGLPQYAAVSFDGKKTFRLTTEGTNEEAMFYMDGIIVDARLPPFDLHAYKKPGRPHFTQQSIKLTGLGGETFDVGIKSIKEMWIKFKRVIPEGVLREWTTSEKQEYPCIDFSNRLFEKKSDNTVEVAFENGVDDDGELKDWGAKKGFVHTDDNKVLYLKPKGEADEERVTSVSPTEFKAGDIVELVFSPIVVPFGLRSILLLDRKFSDESTRMRLAQASSIPIQAKVSQGTLKRKIQYKNIDIQQPSKQTKVVDHTARVAVNTGTPEIRLKTRTGAIPVSSGTVGTGVTGPDGMPMNTGNPQYNLKFGTVPSPNDMQVDN